MKTRKSFVTNSSSSSYVVMSIGGKDYAEGHDGFDLDIDHLLATLLKAKEEGIARVWVSAEVRYDE